MSVRSIVIPAGEKPFTCAFCEKMFASKTNMDSHIQSVHLKIKPFKCGYCEKVHNTLYIIIVLLYLLYTDTYILYNRPVCSSNLSLSLYRALHARR